MHRGASVRALVQNGSLSQVELDDGRTLHARAAVLATGKHDLRGWPLPVGRQNDLIGLKRHFRLSPFAAARLVETVELGLFPGGYAGLEPIEDGLANLCLLVREQVFAAHGRDWRRLLDAICAAVPHIGELLAGADDLYGRPLAIARVPYGLVRTDAGDGVWRLGDQAAVIPSLTGEGMSIALHSATLAATEMLAGGSAATFQQGLAEDMRRQVRLATVVSQALVRPTTQAMVIGAARLFPGALSTLATMTRITPKAMEAATIRSRAGDRPLTASPH